MKMGLKTFHIFLLLVLTYCRSCNSGSTCEKTETAHVKLDLAKQSIYSAKYLFPNCGNETDNSNCSVKDRFLAHLNAALDLISEAKLMCHTCPNDVLAKELVSMDCSDVLNNGFNQSGVYKIWPRISGIRSNESIDVYCDMETDGGGWTLIQRRGDFKPQRSFYQDWETYKKGFGDITQEFWLGNDHIFTLTNQGDYSVRFDLMDVEGERRYAVYDSFSIGDEDSSYVLNVSNYSGNAGDSMLHHNGSKFSTKDRQNDGRNVNDKCTDMYKSAFWFDYGCGVVNLNGIYQPEVKDDKESMWWYIWKESYECLYTVEIKIRRTDGYNQLK